MNANELLFYLRGFTELVTNPTEYQWNALRNEILRAKPVDPQLVPVAVSNPANMPAPCGCKGESNGH